MSVADLPRRNSWLTVFGLWSAVALALYNLPGTEMPVAWLAAFTLPAGLLAALRDFPRVLWQRGLLAAALQTGACLLALHWSGPLDRPAALACTILPPMAFVAVRGQHADAALGLFLSFCVLLVGVILRGPQPWLLGAYIAVATMALRDQARLLVVHGASQGRPQATRPQRAPLLSALLLAPVCALFAFAADRSLALLPSPSRDGAATPSGKGAGGGPRAVGLGDSFVFDGGGRLLDLQGERLVRVDCDGTAPADLYLRSGFFEVPGLDAWQPGRLARTEHDTRQRAWRVREPWRGVPVHRFEIESYQGARNFVFVLPGVCSVRGIGNLIGDARREWFRQPVGKTSESYVVEWQDATRVAGAWPIDPQWQPLGLTDLPGDFDRRLFEGLLAEWQPTGDALTKAARIAAGLAERCRYDRSTPTGPHRHELLNFLFAPADRHGYCMHFASAAAILLRMVGVPCRIGVGLHGGEAVEDNVRARTFGSQHAHAWVEIPFQGRGWVVFDPTPAAERGRAAPQRTDLGTEPQGPGDVPVPDAAAAGSWGQRLLDLASTPWVWAIAIAAAVLLSLSPGRRAPPRAAPIAPEARSARKLLVRLLRQLAVAGHPRTHGQTLETYLRSLQARELARPEFAAAFAAYQEVRFGGRGFDAAREAVLRSALAIAQQLPRADTADQRSMAKPVSA